MSTTRWHARPLVGLTVAKLARDTYQQLRDLDQALDATVGITTLDSLTDVVITTGAAHDTLRYDGTTWRNSAILRNVGTLVGGVTIGTSDVFGHLGTGMFVHAREDDVNGLWLLQMVGTNPARWPYISVLGEGTGGAEMNVATFDDTPNQSWLTLSKYRGTRAAPAHVQANDVLGTILAQSYRGSGTYPNIWADAAWMSFVAHELWTATSRPTRIEWYTIPSGSVTGLLRLTLGSDGFLTHTATDLVTLGTITAAQRVRDDSVTWNNAGIAFIGQRFNLTNTASAVGSKMVDWAIGGTTRFSFQPITGSSVAMLSLTAGNNTPALNLFTNYVTGAGSSESSMVVQATMNTTGNPSLFYVNLVDAGGYGTSTQLMRAAVGGGTLFSVLATGQMGLSGGPTADVAVRIGQGNISTTIEEGLQVNTLHSNTSFLSHWVVNVLGGGAASGSAYTTPEVFGIQVGTYVKATNQTITTWYGLDILAGPTAGTKWSIRTAESVWVKGNLVVDGTISGFSGLGSHTHAETDITDGSLLARVGSTETITGAWTWNEVLTITPDVGGKGLVVTGVTQTTNQPVLDLAQTWNASGVAFEGIKLNITNTASAAGSMLVRVQVGGSDRFYVTWDGIMVATGGVTTLGDITTTGVLLVDGTQVVANRVTGYTAMTGTADRATAYATSTITLQQLAERVKALQDDLTTHGLIGA